MQPDRKRNAAGFFVQYLCLCLMHTALSGIASAAVL